MAEVGNYTHLFFAKITHRIMSKIKVKKFLVELPKYYYFHSSIKVNMLNCVNMW